MWILFGLILMPFLAFLALVCFADAISNYKADKKGLAFAKMLPAIGIVGLILVGFIAADFRDEEEPNKVFEKVFETLPPATVTSLRTSHDSDEPSAFYVQFKAPPATVAALLKGQFSVSPAALPDEWGFPPAWFDTSVAPSTEIYRRDGVPWRQKEALFYDRATNRVRFYARGY